jgi:LmbE family N-acetylglucosaminyl deacetylase
MFYIERLSSMTANKMVVFAPHPDDETLACGGTIMRRIRKGYDVHIVVMTDGRHSHDLVLGLQEPSTETIAKVRTAEFSEATRVLGVNPKNLVLLEFEDNKLSQHMKEAKTRTVQILQRIRPVEVYVPYRDDSNEDHRATYKIVRSSFDETNLLTKMYEYPVWNRNPPHSGLKVIVIDVHNELARKREALSKYDSQISKRFPHQEKPILGRDFVNTFLSDTETFYAAE